MVIGGTLFTQEGLDRVNDAVLSLKDKHNWTHEIKWNRATPRVLNLYIDVLDCMHGLIDDHHAIFQSLILEHAKIDHKRHSQGDKETGFYKFYYQLVAHPFGRLIACNTGMTIRAVFDKRSTKYSLHEFNRVVNSGMRKIQRISYSPVESVSFVDSKESHPMQVNDLLIGAIGFHRNRRHEVDGASKTKSTLADMVSIIAGKKNLCTDTPKGSDLFGMWTFRLATKK